MEILQRQVVGPGGYWEFSGSCIQIIGLTGGIIYDDTGLHLKTGVGFGWEIGGGISTSGNQLVSGMNYETELSVLFYQFLIDGYSAYADGHYHQHGLSWSKWKFGGATKAFYVTQ